LSADPLPDPPPRHDTLVVAGGVGAREAVEDAGTVAWIAAAAARARRTASVCTGAHLLAEAGVLAGRNATTHWRWCRTLARRHPDVELDDDAIFVRDGDVWTSAGVTAGIDLSLALVEEDLGRDVALAVAQELVVFLRRPGGQSQFSRALAAQQATRPALRELQGWIAGHLDADLSVAALAARANLTERSFSRAFRREVGEPPAAYVETLRIERARMLLEDGAESIEAVARATGFASAEVLRRAFHRRVGVSPAAYRERFRAVA
jgi:transcriptional regulator GlxA family with amidase domain